MFTQPFHDFDTLNAFLSEGKALAVVVGVFHETPHQAGDNTDFPRPLRKCEARLRPACPSLTRRNGAPHERGAGGESDPRFLDAGAPSGRVSRFTRQFTVNLPSEGSLSPPRSLRKGQRAPVRLDGRLGAVPGRRDGERRGPRGVRRRQPRQAHTRKPHGRRGGNPHLRRISTTRKFHTAPDDQPRSNAGRKGITATTSVAALNDPTQALIRRVVFLLYSTSTRRCRPAAHDAESALFGVVHNLA